MDMTAHRYVADTARAYLANPRQVQIQPAQQYARWYRAVALALRRTMPVLRRWLESPWLDQRERYLSWAENHEDLERRLHARNVCEQRRARVAFPSCQPF